MIFYRGFVFEWVDYMKAFRVYDPKYPNQTCAYEDNFQDGKRNIDFLYSKYEDKEDAE